MVHKDGVFWGVYPDTAHLRAVISSPRYQQDERKSLRSDRTNARALGKRFGVVGSCGRGDGADATSMPQMG